MMLAATHECIYCLLYLPAQVCVCYMFVRHSYGKDSLSTRLYIYDVAIW